METFDLKKRHTHSNKIRYQLLRIYVITLLLPVSLLGILLTTYGHRVLNNYYMDLLAADNLRVRTLFNEVQSQVFQMSTEISEDENLRHLLNYQYYITDNYNKNLDKVYILDQAERNPEISEIKIYTDNTHFYSSKQFVQLKSNEEWFKNAASAQLPYWTLQSGNLCLIRRIELNNNHDSAVMVIKLDEDRLMERLGNSGYKFEIALGDGQVIYSSFADAKDLSDIDSMVDDSDMEESASYNADNDMPGTAKEVNAYTLTSMNILDMKDSYRGKIKIIGDKLMACAERMQLDGTSSEILVYILDGSACSHINKLMGIGILILLIAIIVPAFIAYFYTDFFTSRILQLRGAMHRASLGEYMGEALKAAGEVSAQEDEITEAFEDLRKMVEQIEENEARMYESRLKETELENEQRKMEFKMLAAQINPHFLYNALETIRMKAFSAGDADVAKAIKILGKCMRYVLENTGTEYASLESELAYVENYLSIQKLRFGEKFDSQITVEDEIDASKIFILPLLLQPVVENALIHGLEEVCERGLIEILISRNDKKNVLTIAVRDNGCGMTEEELESLLKDINTRDDERSTSIGLYNINQRLLLSYGPSFGLKIDSVLDGGTTVCMEFPLESLKM